MSHTGYNSGQAPYVTIDLAAKLTGYTERAIRTKIQKGVWLEGQEFLKGPDGRVLISMRGYTSWVEKGQELPRRRRA